MGNKPKLRVERIKLGACIGSQTRGCDVHGKGLIARIFVFKLASRHLFVRPMNLAVWCG